MATEIGTASDHVDLYTKLYDFLTTNTDLVNAGQNWERVWGAEPPFSADEAGDPGGSDVLLKGPGASGNDSIYVGMRLEADPATDLFGIWFAGAQGVVSSAEYAWQHINSAPRMHMPLFDQSTPYWFVANGRRFVVVAKVSTTFVACYQGFFLPYATPLEYPYPMTSSGCSWIARRWSDESPAHTHFCMPWDNYTGIATYYTHDAGNPDADEDGRTCVMSPAGEWVRFNNRRDRYAVFPWAAPSLGSETQSGNMGFVQNQRTLFGGDHMLYPATLVGAGSRLRGTLGVFEGVYHCPGFGNSAENVITVDGVDHLVVQNLFRTGFTDYWALALE